LGSVRTVAPLISGN